MELLQDFNLKPQLINNELINTISARLLWQKLGSKREFATWIKDRIKTYDFVENIDFIRFDNFVKGDKNGFGNKTTTEYYITINMAKELCMIENNSIGRQFRRYFIQCEKILTTENKVRQRHTEQKYLTQQRQLAVKTRYNMTDKIQDIYGKDCKHYVFSNYTKMVYKKVFGFSDLKKIKQKFNMTDKETIRETTKISQDIKDKITEYEYNIHCILQVLKFKKTPKEICYQKVKEFLQLDN